MTFSHSISPDLIILDHRQKSKLTIDCTTRSSWQASRGPLDDAQPIVIHSQSIDICTWAYGSIYDWLVYKWTTIRLIVSCACPQALYIGRTDIRISTGCTKPSIFQSDYLYSAAMGIENAAVLIDSGCIFYDCTVSAQQL